MKITFFKKYIKTLFIFFLVMISFQLKSQNVVLFDDFVDNHQNWEIDNSGEETTFIKNGKYHIDVNDFKHSHQFLINTNLGTDKDYLIESTIELDSFNNIGRGCDFGIMWGADDSSNCLKAYYVPTKNSLIGNIYNKKKYYNLFGFNKIENNRSEKNGKFKFAIMKYHKKLYLLLNDFPIAKTDSINLFGIKTGFTLSGKISISVDDIKITSINNQFAQKIKDKFSPTEEKTYYYNPYHFTFGNDFKTITKDSSATYRVFTMNDENEIVGYVREYDSKSDKLLKKFHANFISPFGYINDIIDGEEFAYNDEGIITTKIVYHNSTNLDWKDFINQASFDVFYFDYTGTLKKYEEITDKDNLRRRIYFDVNGDISRAQNMINDFFYEKNSIGSYDKIFEESFSPNSSKWMDLDLETSISKKRNGGYYLESKMPIEGEVNRFIPIDLDFNSNDFSVNLTIEELSMKENNNFQDKSVRAGILLGIDSRGDNNFGFCLKNGLHPRISIDNIYNGIRIPIIDWRYIGEDTIFKNVNNLNILKMGTKLFCSINGKLISSSSFVPLSRNTIGFMIGGEKYSVVYRNLVVKELNISLPEEFGKFLNTTHSSTNFIASGTGFFISSNGYIATNNHVIDNAKEIDVDITSNEITKSYKATLVCTDKANDLAIIKINDLNFSTSQIPYSINSSTIDVGSSVFTLGYPYALTYLGKEIKFTDGKISSKSGFNNDNITYQISVPVQPGNSGGPLFDTKGNLVGVVNAKFTAGDNVSYAIKSSILKSYLDANATVPKLTTIQKTQEMPVVNLIKQYEKFVVLIKIK